MIYRTINSRVDVSRRLFGDYRVAYEQWEYPKFHLPIVSGEMIEHLVNRGRAPAVRCKIKNGGIPAPRTGDQKYLPV